MRKTHKKIYFYIKYIHWIQRQFPQTKGKQLLWILLGEKILISPRSPLRFFIFVLGFAFVFVLGVGGGPACQSHPPLALKRKIRQPDLYAHKNIFFAPNKNNPYTRHSFTWPVRLSSLYKLSQRYHPYRSSRRHLGIDIAGPKGDPIYAAHSGRVVYSGRAFQGFGKMVILEKQNSSWSSLYAHLKDIYVHQGQMIQKGQFLGTLGNTGRTTGPHLHFELRKNKKTVNPLKYLP